VGGVAVVSVGGVEAEPKDSGHSAGGGGEAFASTFIGRLTGIA
jgi:hypothetical protein